MKKASFTALCWALIAGSASAQNWTQVTSLVSPSGRGGHAMVYDSARDKVVMFGGGTGTALNETWEYDGVDWIQVTPPNSPSGRNGHAMAYDSARGKVVLFGGSLGGGTNSPMNDTWEFDGVDWAQISPAASPSVRRSHSMAFDSVRGKVVMFGGAIPCSITLTDTWEYDGVNWLQVSTASNPGNAHGHQSAMTFDSARGKVVMFGGRYNCGYPNSTFTWEYDGSSWTQSMPANNPSYRVGHSMAFDSAHGKVVLFGGNTGLNQGNSDTQEYDGVDWAQLASVGSPSDRVGHAMAYDSLRGKVVMFGGSVIGGAVSGVYNDETWEYDGGPVTPFPSSATPYGSGCGSPVLDLSPTANPIIGTVAGALVGNAATPFAGVSLGASNTFAFPVALPFELSGIGMPGCDLLQSNDAFGLALTPVTASTLQFNAAIPFALALLGQHFYIQAYCFAPGANAAQIVTSNGIDWLIGNQ